MCVPGQPAAVPASAVAALALARACLGQVAQADPASLPATTQAELLRGLERAESVQTAARARVLGAFTAQRGFEDDGAGSAGSWLRWQARVTRGAAAGAMGWMRRLAAHPAVAEALAAGAVSTSWAREICAWTDRLPAGRRGDADQILLAAAAGGADLADLAGLAEEMARRTAPPDADEDDRGFAGRGLRLDLHYQGAGKLTADLTPECAAAVTAVLESLGRKAGPEDDRTQPQRDHDALEEACRRLAGSGTLPDVAGQATQVQLHVTLDQLRGLPGGAAAEAAWLAGQAAAGGQPGWAASRAAAEACACDAKIVPVVTAHIDPDSLAALVHDFLARQHPGPRCHRRGCTCQQDTSIASTVSTGMSSAGGPASGHDSPGGPDLPDLPTATTARLTDTLLRYAADALSGPAGLASHLRTTLPGIHAYGISLPLDTGAPTETVPPHLRRAVTARDRHCMFPGCARRPAACHVHHLTPRSRGGPTALHNLALVCAFHHLIAIHRWGWTLALNGDGTTTATSPDRTRTLHSHGPPEATAA
jgi:hypothetical protein